MCFSRKTRDQPRRSHPVDSFHISSLEGPLPRHGFWYQRIEVEGHPVKFKLDPGAAVNAISLKLLTDLRLQHTIQKHEVRLSSYGGFQWHTSGVSKLTCKLGERTCHLHFVVVENSADTPLLGMDACVDLALIKRQNPSTTVESIICETQQKRTSVDVADPTPKQAPESSLNTALLSSQPSPQKPQPETAKSFLAANQDLFQGLGKLPGQVHLDINRTVKPKVSYPNRLAQATIQKAKEMLKQMEDDDVNGPEPQPESWVSRMLFREKPDGTLRPCVDPRPLNKALDKAENHSDLPVVSQLIEEIANDAVFTCLDYKQGFWQAELDEISSKACAVATPFGTYRFKRLPYGLKSSPEIFHKKSAQFFGNIPHVRIYIDDVLLSAPTVQQHDAALHEVLKRARENNVKFNPKKLQYRTSTVRYLGYILTAGAKSINEDRIKAIENLQSPKTKKQPQRVMGLFNYLREFIPQLSELKINLQGLLKQDVKVNWLPQHEKDFQQIKQIIIKAGTLAKFDPEKPITIQADSSQTAIGCALMQEGKPIAYASRSLKENEQVFAPIERECLSIYFSCKKFHYFIYGRRVTVVTDHLPLISIFEKPLEKLSTTRLRQMRGKLLKYNIVVKYLPGKQMHVADCLSRNCEKHAEDNSIPLQWDVMIHSLQEIVPMSTDKMRELREVVARDPVFQQITNYCHNGWPATKKLMPPELQPFWSLKEDIQVRDGLIFFHSRTMIPKEWRPFILDKLHEGHQGVTRCKELGRQYFFWHNMSAEIEYRVQTCEVCQKYSKMRPREPMLSTQQPEVPFHTVYMDLMDSSNKSYLVVVDKYSKWFELIHISNKTTKSVITALISIFSTHGIPKIVISDNVPFASQEFKKFADEWNFQHITTSPYLSRSDGTSERCVQTAKSMLQKCREDHTDINYALLQYRNTPLPSLGVSPAQLLFSRNLRTKVPVDVSHLRPAVVADALDRPQKYKTKYEKQYNRHAKRKVHFQENQHVYIKTNPKQNWTRGKILKHHEAPRSYQVLMEDGSVKRRSSQHMKHAVGLEKPTPFGFPTVEIPFCTTQEEQISNSSQPTTSGQEVEVISSPDEAQLSQNEDSQAEGDDSPTQSANGDITTLRQGCSTNTQSSSRRSTQDEQVSRDKGNMETQDPVLLEETQDSCVQAQHQVQGDNVTQSFPTQNDTCNPPTHPSSASDSICLDSQPLITGNSAIPANNPEQALITESSNEENSSFVLLVPDHIIDAQVESQRPQVEQEDQENPMAQSTPNPKPTARKRTDATARKRRSIKLVFPGSNPVPDLQNAEQNQPIRTSSRVRARYNK